MVSIGQRAGGEPMLCVCPTVHHDVDTKPFVPDNGRRPRIPSKHVTLTIFVGELMYGGSLLDVVGPFCSPISSFPCLSVFARNTNSG